jgi:hypothetical protein
MAAGFPGGRIFLKLKAGFAAGLEYLGHMVY